MHKTLTDLVDRLCNPDLFAADVIPWGSPVPSFGNLSLSSVATLGLNPSNREFVDTSGNELSNQSRRFHTLSSLELKRWSDAQKQHMELIAKSCHDYFFHNPYDGWFRALDDLISGTNASFYDPKTQACHLDLVPYATASKWTELSQKQKKSLLNLTGDTLGLLLQDSAVRLLVLNGRTVVNHFKEISGVRLDTTLMPEWTLPRRSGDGVKGYAYTGIVEEVAGVRLNRAISVLGYNHNIQSSFGVTNQVKSSIRDWITKEAGGELF